MLDSKITVNITGGKQLNNTGDDRLTRNINDSISKSIIQVNDGMFSNPMMKTGADDIALNSGTFSLDMITFNRELITSAYHSCWVFRRIVDQGARDMLFKGISINSDAEAEVIEKVYAKFNRLKSDMIYAIGLARLYGGAASLIMVDDGEDDLSKPLKLKNIRKGSPIRLYTTDRWYNLEPSAEKVTKFTNIDYDTPKYYTFYIDGSERQKVHHSRVLRFVNRKSPRYIADRLSGWGISELEHIYQDMLGHENTKNAAASLVNKALLEIVKVSGMRGMLSGLAMGNTNSQAQLSGQLSMLNNYRSINNLVLMDKEDEFDQKTYQLSGLSELLTTQEDFTAGAAEMPKVLLFGDTKGGLSSDSPAEMVFYANTVNGKQESDLRIPIHKLLRVIFAVCGADVPKDLDFEFESINTMSNDAKQSIVNNVISNCNSMMDMGLMTHKTALEEIKNISKLTGFGTKLNEEDEKLAVEGDKAEGENPDEAEDIMPDEQGLMDELNKNTYEEEQKEILVKNKTFFDKLFRRRK